MHRLTLPKLFGWPRKVGERFRHKNAEPYETGCGGQFMSRLIMLAMTFIGNLL